MLKPGNTVEEERCRLEGLASREASGSGSRGRKTLKKLEHWKHKEGGTLWEKRYSSVRVWVCVYPEVPLEGS